MKLMSSMSLRVAAAVALALASELAQAHSGHGERVLDGHVHLAQLAASAVALIGPFAGELAMLTAAITAFVVWKKLRRVK